MESKELLCEVLLNSYKDLEHLCKICDKAILKCAIKSHQRDVYEAFDMIATLMDEKKMYCNIKVILDEAISKLKRNIELKYRYVWGCRITDMEEMFGVKENTLCNRIIRQKNKLFIYLQRKYTAEQLLDLIKGSRLLMKAYRRLCYENS